VIVVVAAALTFTSDVQGQQGKKRRSDPQKAKCEALCITYKQAKQTEDAEVARTNPRPRHLPMDYKEAIVRIRLLNPHPELNVPEPPIDDELRVYVNGQQTWEVLYGSAGNRAGAEYTLTADALPLRNANVIVRWRNRTGPNAHFFFEIGGSLVCPNDGWCGQVFREGLTFGARQLINGGGLLPFSIPRSEVDFVNAWAWRSSVTPYPAAGECQKYKCQ
jgi:hypothetical protein